MSSITSGKIRVITLILFNLVVLSPTSWAQQTTEQFIPIGMSPGVSGKLSLIGKITAVDGAAGSFSMMIEGSSRVIRISSTTKIWIDRSGSGAPNSTAGMEALESGLRVEVFPRPGDQDLIEWVKIEAL